MSDSTSITAGERRYGTGELVRRLLGLAWQFRGDCLRSVLLSLALLVLGLAGLQLLGVAVDVIRHALDASQRAPVYPLGWRPPGAWTPLRVVTVLSGAIMVQALLRAWLTYQYNMVTARSSASTGKRRSSVVRLGLPVLGLAASDVTGPPKGAMERQVLACWLCQHTTRWRWVSQRLGMGDESRVTQAIRRVNGPAELGLARLKGQLERAYQTAAPDEL
jgi:hypothetical protein